MRHISLTVQEILKPQTAWINAKAHLSTRQWSHWTVQVKGEERCITFGQAVTPVSSAERMKPKGDGITSCQAQEEQGRWDICPGSPRLRGNFLVLFVCLFPPEPWAFRFLLNLQLSSLQSIPDPPTFCQVRTLSPETQSESPFNEKESEWGWGGGGLGGVEREWTHPWGDYRVLNLIEDTEEGCSWRPKHLLNSRECGKFLWERKSIWTAWKGKEVISVFLREESGRTCLVQWGRKESC